MKRLSRIRGFVPAALAVALAVVLIPAAAPQRAGAAGPVTLNVYINGDTNIFDLWNKALLPAFTTRYPQYRTNMVTLLHGNGEQGVIDKILAAKQAGRTTDVDLWETEPSLIEQGASNNLWVKLDPKLLPNLGRVPAQPLEASHYYGVPYRGSSVVVAYNSAYVKTPPKTFDELIAWIKANPGKFTYCDPNTGGSGQAFVAAAVYKFVPPSALASGTYDPKTEGAWDAAWNLLKSLQPAMYNNGFHPNGNVAVLQLLGQQNVYMAPVWSDMGLDFYKRGLLPKTIKFEQITPPLFGGNSLVTVPAGSAHLEGSFTLVNWLLTPEAQQLVIERVSGYPGIDWKYMPAAVREKFAAVAKPYAPFPNSKYLADMLRLWHEHVAGGG